jgi:hypothetical protein
MGSEAGNGQPAPPAWRVHVGWCPSRCVPVSACVISPPPRGEGASGTPWAIFSGEWRKLGISGNVRSAAATASRLYWSRMALPTTLLSNPGEGADRPPARNSPRRTPQVARSAVRAFLDIFLRNLAIQKTYGFVVRNSAYRYTFGIRPTVRSVPSSEREHSYSKMTKPSRDIPRFLCLFRV